MRLHVVGFVTGGVAAHWGALDDGSDEEHARRALAAGREMLEPDEREGVMVMDCK